MDKYEMIRLLDRGTFGSIYLARRVNDGVNVVLKHVERAGASSATEVRALSTFQHPLIVRYHESFAHRGDMIIAMEYVSGGSLYDLLERCTNSLDEDYIMHLLAQLVTALFHMHSRHILHRDLTSRNILLSQDGKMIKLADLGSSKLLQNRIRARSVVGTPEYMSPEICQGLAYGVQSDVWSLGCVVYKMMTLHPPFQAPSLPALIEAILHGEWKSPSITYSPEIHSLLRGMLTVNPEWRLPLSQVAAAPSVALALVKLGPLLTSINVHN